MNVDRKPGKASASGILRIPAPDGVAIWVTQRHSDAGHSRGAYASFNLASHVEDNPDSVAQNRTYLKHLVGCDIQWLYQVHGVEVVRIDRVSTAPTADAAWTEVPDMALAVLTADCIPLALAALDGSAVGVVHAGWRGLAAGVIDNAIVEMGVKPEAMFAWVGPCISSGHYEVGTDVWDHFNDTNALLEHADRNKRYLDLPQVAAAQLTAIGVSQVNLSGMCTFADERFFSHRQHTTADFPGQTGRFATLVARTSASS